MKSIKLGKKTYLTAFVFVMILNVCLGIFLIRNVFAQTTDDTIKNQPPIVTEVVKQEDSPLQITILNVDNSNSEYQIINYAMQNVSTKAIRAATIVGSIDYSGQIITQYFTAKILQTNDSNSNEIIVERANIKANMRWSSKSGHKTLAP